MSSLEIFHESEPSTPLLHSVDYAIIQSELNNVGIRFERWPVYENINVDSSFNDILAAYREKIQAIVKEVGYQSWDIVSLYPDHPDKVILRKKFLSEHMHSEDETRYFVSGKGLFTLHIDKKVYCVLCERGDFISVPEKVRHWFDMGEEPHFIAIRFFNNPEGWVATYTGSDIADAFPTLGNVEDSQ